MDLSTVVDIVSVFAVVSGLIFAGVELRQVRMSRERESALELFNTFQSPELMRAVRLIIHLPDNQNGKQVQELLGEHIDDVYYFLASLEGMGALVYKEELSLKLVEDFFSGFIVIAWLKLRRFIEDERKVTGRVTWAEWVQWLAERVIDRERTRGVVPAYIEHREWKPNQ